MSPSVLGGLRGISSRPCPLCTETALQTSCSQLRPVSVAHALLHALLHAVLGLEGAARPVLRLLLSLQAKSHNSES